MIKVRKANKMLSISEDAKDRYLAMGFSVIDESGKVIQEAVPVDVNQLKLGYAKISEEAKTLRGKVAELEAQNDYLKQENTRLNAELEALMSTQTKEKPTTRKRKQNTEEPAEALE